MKLHQTLSYPFLLILLFSISTITPTFATTYMSLSNGSAEDAANWEPAVNPFKSGNKLSSKDVVIIRHKMTFNNDIKIEGQITINKNASLESKTGSLKIGNGGNTGIITNYGELKAVDIEITGAKKNNTSVSATLYNYHKVMANKISVSDNSFEELSNYSKGFIFIRPLKNGSQGDLVLKNKLQNCGTISVDGTFRLAGGNVTCDGKLLTPLVEFQKNETSQKTLAGMKISNITTGSPTLFKEEGSNISSPYLTFAVNE